MCGDEGYGAMLDPKSILDEVVNRLPEEND